MQSLPSEPPRPAEKPLRGSSERADRYMGRVAAHLATLRPPQRVAFLKAERAKWIARYEAFCARVDSGKDPEHGEDIYDYLLTITALNSRMAKERVANPPPTNAEFGVVLLVAGVMIGATAVTAIAIVLQLAGVA